MMNDSQGNRVVDQRHVLEIWENYVTELYNRTNRPETLEAEPEEEVDTDEKGSYILQGEVEKAIKEMRNRKATGEDDVPGDVLKLLGEGGLKILTKLAQCLNLLRHCVPPLCIISGNKITLKRWYALVFPILTHNTN
jgi:hypothetical protein